MPHECNSCTPSAPMLQSSTIAPRAPGADRGDPVATSVERYWLKSYPPGVPADVDVGAYRSIPAVLAESCERYNHRPAFENMGRVLTYGDVDRLSAAFASY